MTSAARRRRAATTPERGKTAASAPAANPRARQNVVFELGFFFGVLGRSHVALLYEEGVERPSDTDGIERIPLDDAGGWKLPLARELDAAGIGVDWSALK